MLIQMLIHQPQMLGPIVKGTPPWVWGLFAALASLGLSQTMARTASLTRIMLMPIAMTALSIWGAASAFGSSPHAGFVLLAWLASAAVGLAAIAPMAAPAGTRFDVPSRTFFQPGSWVPMLLILGVFLTKYVVGVEVAMQPGLVRDTEYALVTSALYGLFSGIFIGRSARLWRLAFGPGASKAPATLNA